MPRFAVVDIGSHSARLEVVEITGDGPPSVIGSERQVTRVGESVFRTGRVSAEAVEVLCDVFGQMGELCRSLDVKGIRAVATSALRDAANTAEFLPRWSAALGAEIEVISGEEEARLIHDGVQLRWPGLEGRLLIFDIGGGSAELIVSEDGEARQICSLPLGALRLQETFLHSDPPKGAELQALRQHLGAQLDEHLASLGRLSFAKFIGTSATAAAAVSAANRLPRSRRDDADRMGAETPRIRDFFEHLAPLDLAARRRLAWLSPQRAEVIVPGTALLLHVLEALGAPALYYSAAGVRDGLIAAFSKRNNS